MGAILAYRLVRLYQLCAIYLHSFIYSRVISARIGAVITLPNVKYFLDFYKQKFEIGFLSGSDSRKVMEIVYTFIYSILCTKVFPILMVSHSFMGVSHITDPKE